MFRKKPKRTYQDYRLGVLSYSHGLWSGEVEDANGDLLSFRMDGNEDRPDPCKLEMAQKLVASATELRQRAWAYLREREDVREFADNGDFTLDTIDVGREEGSFDLSFGFSEWPDGYVTVRFTAGKPTSVMMGD